MAKDRVFENDVYEQQRINIEKLYEKNPTDWFFKAQMKAAPEARVGFAPRNGICWRCHQDITRGDKAITKESLGNYIITGCPYCHISFCD